MRLVVGLGNPGKEYERSRHNLGFDVLDRLAEKLGQKHWKSQHEALFIKVSQPEATCLLAKPQTFMNNSGRAVAALMHYYKVPVEGLVVITDDLDLAPGKIRLRNSGSDGGHKGLRSIINALGTQQFKRIRIGIGRPQEKSNVVSFVLGRGKEDAAELDQALIEAAEHSLAFIRTGRFENWSSPE